MTERESKIQRQCQSIIRKYNGYVFKNNGNIYTEKGRPDLTACVPIKVSKLRELLGDDGKIGIFVGIELKRENHLNEVSDAQKIVGDKIKNAKGIWIATDCADIVEALMIKFTGE